MINYRIILEKFKEKLELSTRGNTKELRLNKADIIELHQALTSLLLINAELRLTNEALKQNITEPNISMDLDGGRFGD